MLFTLLLISHLGQIKSIQVTSDNTVENISIEIDFKDFSKKIFSAGKYPGNFLGKNIRKYLSSFTSKCVICYF